MFSDAQILYLTEVLGTEPAHYRAVGPAGAATPVAPHVLVWTPPLTNEARDLLTKILASVGLKNYAHVEGGAPGPAKHLLRFAGEGLGRSARDGGVDWDFHALDQMLGASAEITRLKREVWTLLQEFGREV